MNRRQDALNSPSRSQNGPSQTGVSQAESDSALDTSNLTLEMAHVLFMDIVGYSKLLTDEQPLRLRELNDTVLATPEFQKVKGTSLLLSLPTGDGMALSFFGDPEAPVRCAVEIGRALIVHPDLKVRMGVHSGLVYRVADINENLNISGGGINIAQRVMDCGDAGHILISKRVADDLGQLSRWARDLHDLGETEVKHGVRLHVYNLFNDAIGNAGVPTKLRDSKSKSSIFKLVFVVAGLLLVLVIGFVWFRNHQNGRASAQNSNSTQASSSASERSLTYFLIPSDASSDIENERYVGDEQFSNGSKLRVVLIPAQDGALYLVNRGQGPAGKSALNVLFPTPKNNGSSSMLKANQRQEVPVHFDQYRGDELVSIIWTKTPVPELDAIFKEAASTDFEIRKSAQVATVVEFINRNQSQFAKSKKDPQKKQTTVSGSGEILIDTLVLKHR